MRRARFAESRTKRVAARALRGKYEVEKLPQIHTARSRALRKRLGSSSSTRGAVGWDEGVVEAEAVRDVVVAPDHGVAQRRAGADVRMFPDDAALEPRAGAYADAVVEDARADDRDAVLDAHRGADANRPFDTHVVAQRCRSVDAVGARLRDANHAANHVVARAPILRRRADIGPVGALRVEAIKRFASAL